MSDFRDCMFLILPIVLGMEVVLDGQIEGLFPVFVDNGDLWVPGMWIIKNILYCILNLFKFLCQCNVFYLDLLCILYFAGNICGSGPS